ncbi:MAG: AMP-binding protein [Sphaerochaetaceae bacterium]|jgi:long-chain acyl-CoA synthetase|nr:AMP-binding protein [Sphaerochaetaceae bacterium]
MKEQIIYTIQQALLRSNRLYGNRTALTLIGEPESTITYHELQKRVDAFATFLLERGIKKNDKFAILAESHPNWAIAYFAIVSIGAIAVPILPDFSVKEVSTVLEHSDSIGIVVSAKLIQKASSFIEHKHPLTIRSGDFAVLSDEKPLQVSIISTSVDCARLEACAPEEDDIASIIYTSGTTGASKGVMLTHKNITSNAYACRRQFVRLRPGYRMLSILPLSHAYEFTIGLMLGMIEGCEIHYLGKAPAASILLPALKKIRPHIMLSVPLLIEKIYKSSVLPKISSNPKIAHLYGKPIIRKFINRTIGRKLRQTFGGCLKFFGVGGAALDPNVEVFLKEAKFPYAIGYGLTETAPLLAGAGPKQTKPGTTGFALNNVELRIAKTDESSDVGEIQARGPNIMKGYYRSEQATAEVFTEDGWFKTGDLGSFDKKRLSIKGRLKTMILGSTGENIYPELIEMLINNHDFVEESLVVPNEDGLSAMIALNFEAMAENLKTSVNDAREQASAYLTRIKDMVNAELSKSSKISSVHLQDTPFERTPTLKIKRYLYQLKEKISHPHNKNN